MPLLDDQVVNRDRSKFYFTLLTKIDPEPEGFTTRRHTGLGRRERLIPGSYTAGPQSQENPEFSARLAAIFLKGISSPPIDPGWVFLAPVLS